MRLTQGRRRFALFILVLVVAVSACSVQTKDEASPLQTESETSLQQSVSVVMNLTDEAGVGEEIGMVTLEDSDYGLLITPSLTSLSPGAHGFHIHENAACDPAEKDGEIVPGLAAGGHYDPTGTDSHEGPYGDGHLGDVPPLYVDADGNANIPTLAPRLSVADVIDRSLMVHANGDNFSDQPAALGGGGARVACGVIASNS
ncbi:copper/zinc superoxide dismutase [Synechococcus sp. PCC 7335]|uniref:superoxide dismutase family protein n=1 Tax=Synechococcus sp. (strain ATCC 29403 / PCC 7335) TaxID=91464 RepID=UPI00017ED5F4|nr:superoxide dismutase family protein [Synechococcus sp. PCC 7335]EDX87287.1 copper/zinc superoxide dismutase [Synechococcus sp. PCC 7335]